MALTSGFTFRLVLPISEPVRTRKPKLASGEQVVVDVNSGATPGLGTHTGAVNTSSTTEPLPKRALRGVIGFTLLGLLMVFLTYVVLATTVLVVQRADNHNVAVLRNTFPVGSAPTDALVYVSGSEVDQSFMGKVNQAVFGVSTGAVVQIVTGPAGMVTTSKDGHIVVDGKATEYTTNDTITRRLNHQYVAICVAGACDKHKAVIVGEDNIVGEVKGYVTTHGIDKPSTDLP